MDPTKHRIGRTVHIAPQSGQGNESHLGPRPQKCGAGLRRWENQRTALCL